MSESDDAFEPRPPRRWGLLLAVVGVAAVVAAYVLWPETYTVTDCGIISAETDTAALPEDGYCTLEGTVTGDLVLSMGKVRPGDSPAQRYQGVRFFARIGESNVFALLPGHRADVAERYAEENDLQGLQVSGVGHIFDPDPLPGYRGTAKGIRKLFGLPAGAPMRLFDTEDQPAAE